MFPAITWALLASMASSAGPQPGPNSAAAEPPQSTIRNPAVGDSLVVAVGDSLLVAVPGRRTDLVFPAFEVSATRLDDSPDRQPYAYTRRRRDQLDETQGRTLTDNLQYQPGVVIQRTAPNQASPFIRGLTGEQSLLMLNGIRYNHAAMRPGPNQYAGLIADESIDTIDIILGSNSAAMGSDALTGALDFRLAEAGRGQDQAASVWSRARASSSDGMNWAAGLDVASGRWAWTLEGALSRFHDLVGGRDFRDRVFGVEREFYDVIPNTSYRQYALAARGAYDTGSRHRLELSAGATRQEKAPRPDGYFQNTDDPTRVFRQFNPQRFAYAHLRYFYSPGGSVVDRLRTTLWFHGHDEEQSRGNRRDPGAVDEVLRLREFDDAIDILGLDVQGTTELGASHALTWGGTLIGERTRNAYREFRTEPGDTDPEDAAPYQPESWAANTTVPDAARYHSLGVFAQDRWRISHRVALLIALRYSLFGWQADVTGRGYTVDDVDGDADDVTGNLRFSWSADDDHLLFAGVSQGFRAPNLTNLTGRVDRGSSGVFYVGNPSLKPEQSVTFELGAKKTAPGRRASVSVFTTLIDDLIQREFIDVDDDGTPDPVTVNAESAQLWGFELSADYRMVQGSFGADGRLSLVATLSFTRGDVNVPQQDGTIQEQYISRANRTVGILGLRQRWLSGWWTMPSIRFSADYTRTAPRDANDLRMTVAGHPDGGMPGFVVWNLQVGWNELDGSRFVTLLAENLTNLTYRDVGSGIDGPGFGVILSGGVRF